MNGGSNNKKKKEEGINNRRFSKSFQGINYPFDGQERLEEEIAGISEKSMLSTRAKSIRLFSSSRRASGKFWFFEKLS